MSTPLFGPVGQAFTICHSHISWPGEGPATRTGATRALVLIDGRSRGDTARRTQLAGAQRASYAAISRLGRHAGVDVEAGIHASACAEG
jgi:hypothetical protein